LTATTSEAVCAPWRPITYSSKLDTAETARQARIHNQTGVNLKCPEFLK